MKNFKRNKNEKPYYYASSIINGKVVQHEGDPAFAVYLSEIEEMQKRAKRWHEWVQKNHKNAYDSIGILKEEISVKNRIILQQFMDGIRKK